MQDKYLEKIASNRYLKGALLAVGAVGAAAALGLIARALEKSRNTRTAQDDENDDMNDEMIDYVASKHPEFDSSRQEKLGGQIDWAPISPVSKDGVHRLIGVRVADPHIAPDGRTDGTYNFDKVIIHPKYQKQYKDIHLTDGNKLDKSKYKTHWA